MHRVKYPQSHRMSSSIAPAPTPTPSSKFHVDEDFLVSPEQGKDLSCNICFSIMMDAVMINNPRSSSSHIGDDDDEPCGHQFCKSCIELSLLTKQSCPTCRRMTLIRDLVPDMAVRRKVADLRVRCQHYPRRCQWQGELGKNCDKLKEHLKTCIHRGLPCIDCKEIIPHYDASEDISKHYAVCTESKVDCPDCNVVLRRRELSSHQATTCTMRPEICSFKICNLEECQDPIPFCLLGDHYHRMSSMHTAALTSLQTSRTKYRTLNVKLTTELKEEKKQVENLKRKHLSPQVVAIIPNIMVVNQGEVFGLYTGGRMWKLNIIKSGVGLRVGFKCAQYITDDTKTYQVCIAFYDHEKKLIGCSELLKYSNHSYEYTLFNLQSLPSTLSTLSPLHIGIDVYATPPLPHGRIFMSHGKRARLV